MKIKNPLKAWAEYYSNKKREDAIAQVNEDVQLREFNGRIWLSYQNIPLVSQDLLSKSLCESLTEVRAAVCAHKKIQVSQVKGISQSVLRSGLA